MDDKLLQACVAMGTAIIGLAITAVVLSNKAQTTGVIQAVTSGYASILTAAVAPVTGGSSSSSTAS